MKTQWLYGTTTSLRVVSALFGLCCLIFVPRREMADWSSLFKVLYYLVVMCFTTMAAIRFRRVARSFQLTLISVCLAALPFCWTAVGILVDILRSHAFLRADGIVWAGLTLILLLLSLLPAALLLEYAAENSGPKCQP